MNATIDLNPDKLRTVHWSRRGSCGTPGCIDPWCGCGFCGHPVGVLEDDPRWEKHDPDCDGCRLCEDQVPLMLFRGSGPTMEQAQFHAACFNLLLAKKAS